MLRLLWKYFVNGLMENVSVTKVLNKDGDTNQQWDKEQECMIFYGLDDKH